MHVQVPLSALYIHFWMYVFNIKPRGRRGHGRMVVGFTTSWAINAYHH